MKSLKLALILPLVASACCNSTPPGKYSLDQVIASTVQGVRKGMAVGTADTPDPKTGQTYPAIGLPICSVSETWAVTGIDTNTVGGSLTLSPMPVVPAGFSLNGSSSSTRTNANTVVLTWNSPLCSSGGGAGGAGGAGGGGAGAGSAGAGAAKGGAVPAGAMLIFVPSPQSCPPKTDPEGPYEDKTTHKRGYYCYPRGTTMFIGANY